MSTVEQKKKKAEYMKRYRIEHPEQYADTQRRYYASHPGLAAKKSAIFRATHPETPEQKRRKAENGRAYQLAHPEERFATSRKSHLKRTFGMTDEEYQGLYDSQKGKCAICHQAESKGRLLSIDHDHKTGRIRGLLCKRCNVALGNFQDSIENLSSAIEYLKR